MPVFPWRYMNTGLPSVKLFWYQSTSFPCASFHSLSGTVCLKQVGKHTSTKVLFSFFTLEKENKAKAYQTPREIPSSDVKYMLIVWLREKSAGWLRSLKNGTLTVDRKIVADHWGVYSASDKEKREGTYLCECIQSAGSSLTGTSWRQGWEKGPKVQWSLFSTMTETWKQKHRDVPSG